MAAPIPFNETERLAALHALDQLDSAFEPAFDSFVHMATTIFNVPIALISLVDVGRQWFKARVGVEPRQGARDISFCAHAIMDDDVMVVPDALDDPRFRDNPTVVGPPYIRFYAGAPLITRQGYAIGTLCLLDRQPRAFPSHERTILRQLARETMGRFELHRALRDARRMVLADIGGDDARRDRLLTYLDMALDGPAAPLR